MALSLAIALRPWRALRRALGMYGLSCGLALAAGAVTAAPALAASATVSAGRPAAGGGKKAAKSKKASKSSRSGKASRGTKATRTSKSRHSGSTRATRPAPRPSDDLHSADAVAVPQVIVPEIALATAAPGTGNPFALITRSATSLLDGLVARARGQLGTRYVYGATDPDNALDCSSFARYVMEALNVRLPRTANQQARVGAPVPRDLTALRPGDLLTFGSRRHTSHVGIYLGQGRFIHASVKSGQVIETTIDRNQSLFRRWQGARRLLAGVVDSLPLVGAPVADELATGTSGG